MNEPRNGGNTAAVATVGYSSTLYDELTAYGLRAGQRVIDFGGRSELRASAGGDGLDIIAVDSNHAVPSAAESTFDVAVSAQTLHALDTEDGLARTLRAVRSGGTLAIWWKVPCYGDPVERIRGEAAGEFGVAAPAHWLAGGFRAFYAAPVADRTLRVIPWAVVRGLDEYLDEERSAPSGRAAFGARFDAYMDRLEAQLREALSGGIRLPLTYVQYLYLGRKP